MNDESSRKNTDHVKFTFTNLGYIVETKFCDGSEQDSCKIAYRLTWPLPHRLAKYEADVHWRLLHFRGKIDGGSHDSVWIRPPDLNFHVESADVDLSSGDWLLSKIHTTSKLGDLCT